MKNTPDHSNHRRVNTMTLSAMFAALTCAATIIIQVPAPMNGYVHLGDTAVLLSAFVLGPIYGSAAAGIGSCLADLFTGYLIYAPATLVIKALSALIAGLIYLQCRKGKTGVFLSAVLAGLAGEAWMIIGYFCYGIILFGSGTAALLTIPGNGIQALFGLVSASVISTILSKVKIGPIRMIQ